MFDVYTMDTCTILCCNNMTSLIHLFHNSTVCVMNSRVSGKCVYTIHAVFTYANKCLLHFTRNEELHTHINYNCVHRLTFRCPGNQNLLSTEVERHLVTLFSADVCTPNSKSSVYTMSLEKIIREY